MINESSSLLCQKIAEAINTGECSKEFEEQYLTLNFLVPFVGEQLNMLQEEQNETQKKAESMRNMDISSNDSIDNSMQPINQQLEELKVHLSNIRSMILFLHQMIQQEEIDEGSNA